MSRVKHGPEAAPALLSENQVGVVIQFNSGMPFTVTSNRDLNLDGNNGDRPLYIGRNSCYLPARWNVDARLSRFIPLGSGRRVEVLAEFKNIFNIVQTSSVRNGRQRRYGRQHAHAAGLRLVRSTLTSLPTDSSDFLPTDGYEQRKFQLGFKFSF